MTGRLKPASTSRLFLLLLLPMLGLAQPAPVTITLVRWPFT